MFAAKSTEPSEVESESDRHEKPRNLKNKNITNAKMQRQRQQIKYIE